MFSKQSLKFFKSNLAFFKGQGSQGVCMKQNLSSRSTGRLSRLDFGPKPADASCSTRNDRAGEHYRLATYPRGYQLEKNRVKAARLSKLPFPAPAPNPQPPDPFGSPNIYRAPGLRGGDSKFACACFRPTERTTSWGLADHVRRHEAQTAGIPFQWPPAIQEALPTVQFAFESLCQHCRGGHQEAQIIVHDEIMTDAPEELWDVDMYDTVIDVPMEDAPPLEAFFDHSFPTHLRDRSVDARGAPASASAIPWYVPCLQGSFESQQRPALQQAPELGHFTPYGGPQANSWVKKSLQGPAFQTRQDMETLHPNVNDIQKHPL